MNLIPENKRHFNDAFSLERGVEVNARSFDDWTPLHVASSFGNFEIARTLLDHGASANAKNNAGETPLYLVSRGVYSLQHDGICTTRLLLERGADANARRKDHHTPLHAASYRGRFEIVQMLLDHGANVNAENRLGKNALDLVSRGEYESREDGVRVAQLLLERGVDANASNKEDWAPLHSASYYGNFEIVRVLLDHGAKADAGNEDGETALSLVSRGEYHPQSNGVRIVQSLLERGADVNGQPKAFWTPLNWASFRGRLDIVRVLLDRGATLVTKKNFRTALHAVSGGEYESQEDGARIAQLLLDRGADVNAQNIYHETPLLLAAISGKPELARVLLDHGAKVTETQYGRTPLHAIPRGNYDSQDGIRLVQLLVERGADVGAPDQDHDTALHSACLFGKLDIARELLDHGATVTAKNDRGETPLHATSQGESESQDGVHLAQLLLERGADVGAPDNENTTPLHFACRNGKLDIARLLLKHGAVASAKNRLGETPLHVVSKADLRVARLLLEHGVDVNIHDKDRRTPLHAASLHGNLEIAQLLLDHGAAVNATDDYGWTPLYLLSQYRGGSVEPANAVARLLLERGAGTHLPDINYMTSLDLFRGWPEMVQVLLEHGATFILIYTFEY